MKKFLLLPILLFSFWIASPAQALEKIESYEVNVFINQDSSLDVQETIEYNFGTEGRHGIYRDIPLPKRDWRENPLELYRIKTYNENGKFYQKDISEHNNLVSIRIGSEDELVYGKKTYVISYRVMGAFDFVDDGAFLSWNAIGTDWKVPIEKTNVNVYFPKDINESQFDTKCFWGENGSTEKCLGEYFVSHDSQQKTIRSLVFKTDYLGPWQGITIDLKFQPGVIEVIDPPNVVYAWFKHFGFILWPIFTFFIMLYIWFAHGRDPKGRGVIIAQYDAPKDMMPAELGSIYDESVHSKDISAEIIYLAIKGYLKIHRIKKSHIFAKDDYVLEQLKNGDDLTRQYQRDLLEKLFSKPSTLGEYSGLDISMNSLAVVKVSDLSKSAHEWMKDIYKEVYEEIHAQGYFHKNPNKIRNYYSVGIIAIVIFLQILFMGGLEIAAMISDLVIYNIVSIVISGFIVFMFGFAMPKKTVKGVRAKEYILGLKLYINVAEKDRINFHNAPEKNPDMFEKLLPYAMAFGLEKKWAKQFEGMHMEEPEWYAGSGAHFSAVNLGASLNGFRSATAQASRSSSGGGVGGGGFSGGGVGGGGGGSW